MLEVDLKINSMSETEAKELISQERETLYELISLQKIPAQTGAEALSSLEIALGSQGGGGGTIDVSTLAKESTLGEIESKLPNLSNNAIPVEVINGATTPDIRVINTPNSYDFNNYYSLYIKVISGANDSVIIKKTGEATGVALATNEYLNFEPIAGRKHGSITLTIASGGIVRIIGES